MRGDPPITARHNYVPELVLNSVYYIYFLISAMVQCSISYSKQRLLAHCLQRNCAAQDLSSRRRPGVSASGGVSCRWASEGSRSDRRWRELPLIAGRATVEGAAVGGTCVPGRRRRIVKNDTLKKNKLRAPSVTVISTVDRCGGLKIPMRHEGQQSGRCGRVRAGLSVR